jgi:hypothetical protein
MPEERPDPLAPRPVVPIDEPTQVPIAEPGVVTPAPFAQVYNAQANPPAVPPPPPPSPYYPPAYPQQWPVAPAYVVPGRPGLLTAIGVLCIVVASLSIIASFISGCSAVAAREISAQSRMSARMGTGGMPPGATMGGTANDAGPNGFAANERAIFANALSTRRRLSKARSQQLDTFLKEHGRLVLQPAGALTQRTVTAHIASHGQEFSDQGKGPDYFVFMQGKECETPGRLRIFDDRAVYSGDDNVTVLRSAYDPTAPQNVAPPFTPTMCLDKSDAGAVVNQVKKLSNNKLNASQAQSLQGALELPQYTQWLTPSSTTVGLTSQVKSVVVQSDGTATITWANGTNLVLLPNGDTGGAVLKPTTNPAANALGGGVITLNRSACNLGLFEAISSALLAIFLLVTGILVLRQMPASRWMLLLYSLIKLALGVTAIVAFGWMISTLKYVDPGHFYTAIMGEQITGMSVMSIVLAALGILFPISLLIVLISSKTVKDYYK